LILRAGEADGDAVLAEVPIDADGTRTLPAESAVAARQTDSVEELALNTRDGCVAIVNESTDALLQEVRDAPLPRASVGHLADLVLRCVHGPPTCAG